MPKETKKKTRRAGKKAKRTRKAKKKTPRKAAAKPAGGKQGAPAKLYTLEVLLASGPITETFAGKNKVVMRRIAIRGDQTLEDLHHAIFDAFDFEEEHMYEFQFGEGFHDPKGATYVLPGVCDSPFDSGPASAGDVTKTTLGSLGLKVGRHFGHWFDFGDDWLHQIDVVAIKENVPRGEYPKVVARKGQSPPQYVNWDEEDE